MGDKAFYYGLGVVSTAVGVFALSRLLQPTIRANLINEIQSRVISRVSVFQPFGVTLTVDDTIRNAVMQNISVPLADGIMAGLWLS